VSRNAAPLAGVVLRDAYAAMQGPLSAAEVIEALDRLDRDAAST
jgi:hypothetical protein